MTTIEYLHQPGMIRQEIARKIVRIENLRRYAARLTAPVREVEVQSTPDPARMQAFLSEVADTEKEIDDLRKILEKALDEIAVYTSGRLPSLQTLTVYPAGADWFGLFRND